MEAFITTFFSVLIVELTDRTRILAMLLSARYRAPVQLIAGMTLGYIPAILAAVLGAGFIGKVIPETVFRAVIGFIFLGLGIYFLASGGDDDEDGEKEKKSRFSSLGPFWSGFILVALNEFADKSQIMTASMMIRYGKGVPVFFGSLGAQALLNVIYVLAGQWLGKRLPESLIRKAAGFTFIVFALWTFAGFFI